MTPENTKTPEAKIEASEARCAVTAGSAFVHVQCGSGEPELASRLVWWLARWANWKPSERLTPQVGDWVIETTHIFGLARKQLGLLSAVGELLKIEKDGNFGGAYTIRTLEGKEQRWSNAHFEVLDRTNVKDEPRRSTVETKQDGRS